MRLLTLMLLSISLYTNGQPGVELGISGGPLFTTIKKSQSINYKTKDRQAYSLSADLLGNVSKQFSLSYGIHLMGYSIHVNEERYDVKQYGKIDTSRNISNNLWLMAAAPIGVHYKIPTSSSTTLRLAMYAGPFWGTNFYNEYDELIHIYTSAYVGLAFNKRYSIGASASKIFGGLGAVNGVYAVQADARVLLPSVKDVSSNTRNRINNIIENNEKMRPYKQAKSKERKRVTYLEASLSGGVLFPFVSAEEQRYGKNLTAINTGYIIQGGFDILNRKTAHNIKLSVGARFGGTVFSAKDSSHTYDGRGQHGTFVTGLHYMKNPASPQKFRVALYAGGGLRADGSSDFGILPYYHIEGNAVKYFTNTIGVGFITTYIGFISASRRVRDRYYSIMFSGFATSLDVRICLSRNRRSWK